MGLELPLHRTIGNLYLVVHFQVVFMGHSKYTRYETKFHVLLLFVMLNSWYTMLNQDSLNLKWEIAY